MKSVFNPRTDRWVGRNKQGKFVSLPAFVQYLLSFRNKG